VQLPREEGRGCLQNLVGTPQFPDFPLQLHDPLRIHSGDPRPLAGVDLRLPDPVTQSLPVDTQPASDPGNRTVLLPGLLPDLERHPHGPLTDLVRVLLRCWHDSYLRKVRSLQRTRGGSTRSVNVALAWGTKTSGVSTGLVVASHSPGGPHHSRSPDRVPSPTSVGSTPKRRAILTRSAR